MNALARQPKAALAAPPARFWRIGVALLAAAPAVWLRVGGIEVAPLLAIAAYGGAVVAAAFLLVWAAEAARHDISGSLATALLAVVAVLPEYAVDLYFAWSAGHAPDDARYAAANMTGSNRLLIGLGWPFVAMLFAAGLRARGEPQRPVELRPERRLELLFLAGAGAYSLVIVLTRRLAWYDSAVLLALFGAYLFLAARGHRVEPELVGVARDLGELPRARRRWAVSLLFAAAASLVLVAAAPFAHALVAFGRALHVDEFLLVQWLAPIASETPELLVAGVLAFRGDGDSALGTLLSAKVNQWTLLVGSLPVAFVVGGGAAGGFALDARQHEEFVLTAAQTMLGLAALVGLRLTRREAAALLALFLAQFAFPQPTARLVFAAAYVAIAVALLVARSSQLRALVRR